MLHLLLMMLLNQYDPSTSALMEEVYGSQGEAMMKNKPHLITFYESILASL